MESAGTPASVKYRVNPKAEMNIMKKRNFTLVELLIVIGIIGILAGMVFGGIAIAQRRGRVTQARADMTSIRTAFEGMYRDYGKMAKGDKLGGKQFTKKSGSSPDYAYIEIGDNKEDYCRAIAELTDPSNTKGSYSVSLNNRKIKYLDPRPEYDPSKSPTDSDNQEHTWLDPWGNPYMMRIDVGATETIPDPSKSGKYLSARIVLWSLGPDGKGSSTNEDAEDNKDNIAGWKDGDWLD